MGEGGVKWAPEDALTQCFLDAVKFRRGKSQKAREEPLRKEKAETKKDEGDPLQESRKATWPDLTPTLFCPSAQYFVTI